MALSGLFMEVLMVLNHATLPTAEFLRGSVRTWVGQKVHGLAVLPLLTAACRSLASVRHMAETTEACITAYFREGEGPPRALAWPWPCHGIVECRGKVEAPLLSLPSRLSTSVHGRDGVPVQLGGRRQCRGASPPRVFQGAGPQGGRLLGRGVDAAIPARPAGSLHQSLGWGPILVSLQVPELATEDFLRECLGLGGLLTLHVYLLQRLNGEQTLRNEMKVLLLLSEWLEQVDPR